MNIVLIGISDKIPEYDDKYDLHRLLSTLFSMELIATEKLGILVYKRFNADCGSLTVVGDLLVGNTDAVDM